MLELLMILMDIVEESVCDEKLPELLDNLQEVLVTCSRCTRWWWRTSPLGLDLKWKLKVRGQLKWLLLLTCTF